VRGNDDVLKRRSQINADASAKSLWQICGRNKWKVAGKGWERM